MKRTFLDINLWSRFARRIMAVLVGAGLLVGGLLTWVSTVKQKTQLQEALLYRGKALVRALGRAAFIPLVLEDGPALDALSQGFMAEPDVIYVALYSPKGRVLSQAPKERDLSLDLAVPLKPEEILERRFARPGRRVERDLVLPLYYGTGEDSSSEIGGYARIGLTEERVQIAYRTAIWNNLALSLGLMAAAFVTGALIIQRMTRQMSQFLEEVRMAEELKRSNKELEAFSYSVAHDLRTPLRAIDGFSHLFLEEYGNLVDSQGRDYLERVRAGCLRMGRLIDDLLALSRVIRQEMRYEYINLAVFARSIMASLAESDPGRRVEFSAPEQVMVWGDPGLLRSALENLLGNAWKYTSKTSDAKVEFGFTKPAKGETAYFIKDNGAGFDMAYANKLFGAFQRLHDASQFPGSGIGLATVQRIIHRHGGKVWAEGAVGKGAVFYFTLGQSK